MWENKVNIIDEFEKIREKSPENKRRSDMFVSVMDGYKNIWV